MFILKKSQLVNTFKQETLKMQNQRTSVFIYFITYYVQLGFFSQLETTLSTPLSAVSIHSKFLIRLRLWSFSGFKHILFLLSYSGVTRVSIGVCSAQILGINPRMTFARCFAWILGTSPRMTFKVCSIKHVRKRHEKSKNTSENDI